MGMLWHVHGRVPERFETAGLLAGPVSNAGVFFRQPEVGHCYFQVRQPHNLGAADRWPRSAARCGRGRADPASAKHGGAGLERPRDRQTAGALITRMTSGELGTGKAKIP
jgi:hypothetical protein